MNKQEAKAATTETLRKVEPEHLEAFITALKQRTFFERVCGRITEDVAEGVLEAADKFQGAMQND